MPLLIFSPRFAMLFLLMITVAMLRIPTAYIPVLSNFTPVGAIALFGGHYFNNKLKAGLFPLIPLLMSDLIINNLIYDGKYGVMHGGWYWIYASFFCIAMIGKYALKKITVTNIILAAILSTIFYWLIVDGMVWIGGGNDIRTMLPLSRDVAGLVQSYWQGLPFMKNFLTGTLLYSAILFGIFEWMKHRIPVLKTSTI